MAEITCTTPRTKAARTVADALRDWWHRRRREAEIRAAIHTLRGFDNHRLDDIGLPRSDIIRRVRGKYGD